MATYFLFGQYTAESAKNIDPTRTQKAVGIIEAYNGQITAMYSLLGEHDLVFIVNLPGNGEAMQVQVELTRLTGIHFTTAPAVSVDRFDKLISGCHHDTPNIEDIDIDEELGDA